MCSVIPHFCLLHSADSTHTLTDGGGVKKLFSWFPRWQLNGKTSLIDCNKIQALTGKLELSATDKLFVLAWNRNLPDSCKWGHFCAYRKILKSPLKKKMIKTKNTRKPAFRYNRVASVARNQGSETYEEEIEEKLIYSSLVEWAVSWLKWAKMNNKKLRWNMDHK